MALRDAVMAALLDSEASGYDLAKGFDGSVANYWAATPQQLYRELDRLAAEGLIVARVVEQERRPNKRVYNLTDEGRAAVRDFTEAPPRPSVMRDELLVKVAAVEGGSPDSVCAAIDEQVRRSTDKLERYERLRARLLDGRSEEEFLADAPRVGPYLTLLRGISFEEENIRWGRRASAAITARTHRRP
ncbi:DNA-binding PadR family transcriptional regulator [Mycobacterium sp. MAA66]|jgi:DNA-binding PadR family transcriptional regulator|uniref:PadR family transcriptional regulator n=1 Tax=Mycobacterium sp. MAA66 TaxID=3156297 RepID=UPI0035147D41